MNLLLSASQLQSKVMDLVKNKVSSSKTVFYVSENSDWVIRDIGNSIARYLKNYKIITNHFLIRNSIVHYGSVNTFLNSKKINLPHKSNKIIVTWFHILPNDGKINFISDAIKYVNIWHTASTHTKDCLVEVGIPEDKIVVIPLGINLKQFYVPTPEQKVVIRKRIGIPEGKVVIGSFQKDGNGWGEGLEPKLIKGPDIFCDVVKKLSKKYDVFVLLTGPARGYVKSILKEAGIPFIHHFLKNPDEVTEYYRAIDLYIVASRIEGGPKQILESLASGVPLISTKVGMVCDVIINGKNGFLVDIENSDEMVVKAGMLIDNKDLQNKFVKCGLEVVKHYDWENIAGQYYQKIYKNLL